MSGYEADGLPADQAMECPCGRKLRNAPLMRSATIVLRRTCPRCRRTWTVKVRPMAVKPGRYAAMEVEYTDVTHTAKMQARIIDLAHAEAIEDDVEY